MTAYFSYDSLTGDLLTISWEPPSDSFIEIEDSIAEKFMLGNETMHNYFVHINQKILKKKEVKQRIPKTFWSLKILDGTDSDMKISARFNQIFITLGNASNKNLMLFGTIKNDPSWLINSWDLSDYIEIDGTIIISLFNAEDFSYYIGRIR